MVSGAVCALSPAKRMNCPTVPPKLNAEEFHQISTSLTTHRVRAFRERPFSHSPSKECVERITSHQDPVGELKYTRNNQDKQETVDEFCSCEGGCSVVLDQGVQR